MKVFRVENENGTGCYQAHLPELYDMYEDHAEDYHRPHALSDKGIERIADKMEIHAFKDMEQARKWFTEKDLELVKEFGFELKEVEAKEITAVGEKQILIIR